MAIGPVQLLVLGFEHPDFHGEIIEELEKLRESDTVRVIDSLAVYKDAAGEMEVMHLSNLSKDEAIELGSKVAALIGLGIEGEEGFENGAELGAEVAAGGHRGVLGRGGVGRPRGDPERLRGGAAPDRAPLGRAAARRDRARRRYRPQRTASSILRISSRSASPLRRRPRNSRRCTRARHQRSEPAKPGQRHSNTEVETMRARRVARRTSRRVARRR